MLPYRIIFKLIKRIKRQSNKQKQRNISKQMFPNADKQTNDEIELMIKTLLTNQKQTQTVH